jgi:hypothetical protein
MEAVQGLKPLAESYYLFGISLGTSNPPSYLLTTASQARQRSTVPVDFNTLPAEPVSSRSGRCR